MPYNPKKIESKWQEAWEKNQTFRSEIDHSKPKFYALDMFPYPSGAGLHVGHPLGYTATDIISRFKRMNGFNVLHPMGWDSFGLPAERYAVRTGIHPAITTKQNVATFKSQIKALGFSYDWSRELATTDPQYVRWTQWIFLKLYERGLAYQADVAVNWCPALSTVLANEEVKDGRYVETGDPVERRLMRQWMLKITAYAERLLEDLEGLDWPEGIKAMQRNWIGKSRGAEVNFGVAGTDVQFKIFTTRPDTLFGATFCVLAPEHPLINDICTAEQKEDIATYVEISAKMSARQRSDPTREKTGVFTGSYAVNPVNGRQVPIWIADYVTTDYGEGAIMAVPAHDERDHEFARKFDLPIIQVVSAPADHDIQTQAWTGRGEIINSDFLDTMQVDEAISAICNWLENQRLGKTTVKYRLRDWLFSRQRYWGEPIPFVHSEDGTSTPVPECDLPLLPPELDEYGPADDGAPPLARATEWVNTTDPVSGKVARRDLNTMPQWAGSCWYYLRFIDPENDMELVSSEVEKYWMPVDLYVGGAEHAVLHLLYARFWHKVLYDIGVVTTKEPFQRLFNQGMILAHSYKDEAGKYYELDQVEETPEGFFANGQKLNTQIEKMSKSRFNVVNPDDMVREFGADSVRLYEMFMGPLDATKTWKTSGVAGVRRFLNRVWRVYCGDSDRFDQVVCTNEQPTQELNFKLHSTIQAITNDMEAMSFNTSIARLMELSNVLAKLEQRPRVVLEQFLLLLAPFAPHIAEELWSQLGHEGGIAYVPWPKADGAVIANGDGSEQEYPVQINGKLRVRVMAPPNLEGDALLAAVKAVPAVSKLLENETIISEIPVPNRLVNFVIKK